MERFAHNGLLHMGGGRLRAVAVPVLHRHVFGGNGLVNGRHRQIALHVGKIRIPAYKALAGYQRRVRRHGTATLLNGLGDKRLAIGHERDGERHRRRVPVICREHGVGRGGRRLRAGRLRRGRSLRACGLWCGWLCRFRRSRLGCRRRRGRVDNILSERACGHAGEHHREHQNHTHDATQSVGCVFHAFFLLLECVLIVHLGREMYLTYSV